MQTKSKPFKTKMLKKLAESFDATHWGVSELIDPDEACSFLDITPEQITLLCGIGAIRGAASKYRELAIPRAELVRFMEAHGSWWFTVRGKQQLERLRKEEKPAPAAPKLKVA